MICQKEFLTPDPFVEGFKKIKKSKKKVKITKKEPKELKRTVEQKRIGERKFVNLKDALKIIREE